MATAIKTDPGMDYHSGSGEYISNFFYALLFPCLRPTCFGSAPCLKLPPATPAGSSPSSAVQASVRPSSLSPSQTRRRDMSSLAKTVCTDFSMRFVPTPHGYRTTGVSPHAPSRCTMLMSWLHIRARASVVLPQALIHTLIVISILAQEPLLTHVKRSVHILVRLANHDARLLFKRHCYRVSFSCLPTTFVMSVGGRQERQLYWPSVCYGEQRAVVINRQ